MKLTHSGGAVARNSEYVMTGELPCIKCSIKIHGFVIIKKGGIVIARAVSTSQTYVLMITMVFVKQLFYVLMFVFVQIMIIEDIRLNKHYQDVH